MKRIVLGAVALASVVVLFALNFGEHVEEQAYISRGDLPPAEDYRGYAEYMFEIRKDLQTGEINPLARQIAIQEVEKLKSNAKANSVELDWIDMGPDNVGGRTRAIVVDKDNPRLIYAGAVSGGLWKSTNFGGTWTKVEAFSENLVISTMAQLPNGTFIIGTGCSFESGGGTGGSGFAGYGIYISYDNLETFSHAVDENGDFLRPSTQYANSGSFVYTNEIIPNPTNADEVWVAYDRGIARYNTATRDFIKIDAPGLSGLGQDIDVSADGQTVVAIVGGGAPTTPYLSKDAGQTWTNLRTEGKLTVPPASQSGRMEVAISKDDANYIYISMARLPTTELFGVFGTENGGESWVSLLPGIPSFNYFSNTQSSQGNYDQTIEVFPGQPGVVLLGGVTLWKGGFDAAPEQIAQNFAPLGSPSYVHSDIHEFTFGQDGTLWIGCDGGIHRSTDNALTFTMNNRGYNTVTFYDIDFSNDGRVIGGAQDNGTQLIDFKGITQQTARRVIGGDGFDVGFSRINPEITFGTIQFSELLRSQDGLAYESFYDFRTGNLTGAGRGGIFYSTFQYYENENDPLSEDSVVFENKSEASIPAGTELIIESKTLGQTFRAVTQQEIGPNGSAKFKDPYTSILASGFSGNNAVWITRGAMQFGQVPQWFKILEAPGQIREIEFGPDGTMYATNGSTLYRVTGLRSVWNRSTGSLDVDRDSAKVFTTDAIWPNSSNFITSISADPNNPERILVTRGNYNGSAHVYICENALDPNPTFVSIQGDLPDFPVYSGRIDMFNPNQIVVGTEVGVFASDDLGQTWVEKNGGEMDRVPVYEVDQQSLFFGKHGANNTGFYYIGTHGRGAFRAENYFTSVSENEPTSKDLKLKVYPNPTSSLLNIETGLIGTQNVQIFDNSGKVVFNKDIESKGTILNVDLSGVYNGNYIVRVATPQGTKTAHFIKQ